MYGSHSMRPSNGLALFQRQPQASAPINQPKLKDVRRTQLPVNQATSVELRQRHRRLSGESGGRAAGGGVSFVRLISSSFSNDLIST